eukprot:gene7266-8077_t
MEDEDEKQHKHLFTPRSGTARLNLNNFNNEDVFLIDLEEEEKSNNDSHECYAGTYSKCGVVSCDPPSIESTRERNTDENIIVEESCYPNKYATETSENFTICEKCLSNRKGEFPEKDLSDSPACASSLENPSKEICICLKDKPQNIEKDLQSNDSCVTQLSFQDSDIKDYCEISNLPDELMLKIFSYFSLPDLCRYVAPICITWLQYARDSTLWESITEDEFKDIPSDLLVKVLTSWCSLLRCLELKCRSDMTLADFILIFKACPLIESISFAFCPQMEDEMLQKCAQYLNNVHCINFEGCLGISDASVVHLFGKPIHGINLSHCTMITDEGVIFLARNFSSISHINLDGIQWISHAAVEVLTELHSHTLQEIILDGAELTDDSVRKLSISFCDSLTDNSLQWLMQLKQLNSLQLKKGSYFSTEGMLHFLKSLKMFDGTGLTYLNLAECTALSDNCLHAISESCPKLKMLNLSWCWEVTDDGINFILDSCHHITELYLCGLHELYGIPFRRISSELPNLKYLDLRQCNKTSDDLLADLANEIKTLKILNYYGDVVQASLNYWNLESKCSPGHFHHVNYSK